MDRRRRQSLTTLPGLVSAGRLLVGSPTTDTGHRIDSAYGKVFLQTSTNLVRDPQCVNALGTYWGNPSDGHLVATPNTTCPVSFGVVSACMALAFDGTGTVTIESEVMAATASKSYTLQALVYAPTVAGGGSVAAAAVVMNGASEVRTVALGTVSAVNSTSVRYSNTVAIAASGETHIKYRYTFTGAAVTCYVSGHKNAQQSFCDVYHDGATAQCAWTGTANASTSTRTGTLLVYALPSSWTSPMTGLTMCARCQPYWAAGANLSDSISSHIVALATNSGGSSISMSLQKRASNNYLARFYTYNGTTNKNCDVSSDTHAANDVISFVARYDGAGGTVNLRRATTDFTQTTGAGATTQTVTHISVGGQGTSGAQFTGGVGPIVIVPSDVGSSHALMGYESMASDIVALYRAAPVGALLIPLQGDTNSYLKVA